MAENQQADESFGMKVTCFGIRKKFPSVQQLATSTLSEWLHQKKPVTILVISGLFFYL